jgi:hypothetical protein
VKRALTLAALAGVLAGCGGGAHPRAPTKLQIARARHEYPSPPKPRQAVRRASPSALGAIRSFASAYINWSADTVASDMRALAARSVAQARSALELAAAQTASDYELKRGGIANSGTVEAVAPLPGARDRYVVVTRESTTATNTTAYDGLRPAWHVALATVVRVAGEWAVSGWEPQS